MKKVQQQVRLPTGYHIDWAGEYESQKRSQRRLLIVLPITILIIYIILFTMFKSAKWAALTLANVSMAPIGGILALLLTGTHFSVSSGVGFLALFGVSVQVGVIMIEYINHLRARGYSIEDAAVEGAILRLRPIMMTMLIATLGLLPAALSRHRLRFATAIRHRDCRRAAGGPVHEHLSATDDVRLGGPGHGSTAPGGCRNQRSHLRK